MRISKFKGRLGFKKLHLFNLALLAKQGWKILKNTDFLLHLIYKTNYFPNVDFFDTKLSINLSYAWQGIWEVSKWLYKGCRWRINDGSLVRLWLDPWVPSHRSLEKFYNDSDESIQTIMVSSIISNGMWNTNLIRSLVHHQIAGKILKIQLGSLHQQDNWLWGRKNWHFLILEARKSSSLIYMRSLKVNLLWSYIKTSFRRNCDI